MKGKVSLTFRLTPEYFHMPVITYREALNQALREEMRRDERVFLMGEEVGLYQGAYKVSQGLLEEFGEKRVIDTPITEEAFTGVGVGAAMVGLRPVIEMMTFNFSIVAMDQIVNSAAKIRYMSGGQFKIPMVIRGPGGAAHSLAAQHSHSLETWFCYVPGLKVVMPGVPKDAKGLLKSAIRDDNPVIFIEGELLYGTKGEVPEGEYTIPLGKADIKRKGSDVTIIAYSKMVLLAMEAAEELAKEGIEVEIVDPRTLRPLDETTILNSVRKTNRAVIVEEGWEFGGFGAQIAEIIYRKAFDYIDAPIERVAARNVPMPYAKNLEMATIPNKARVIEAVKKVLYFD
ncbi:MAG TPA: pyruvate dehydrogenase complex E1 component subunit beta [Candidatus Limnocylindrales bacterium]|nr:pyruvate dehydrogenase complex E1 component subunit beta [Candidatus Limnocylindrales bacterium]